MPMEDSDAILDGTASRATTIMYIIIRNRTADTTLEKNPNARQNRGYLARRSMVFMPSWVFIMMQGPYLQRWYLSAFSGHLQTQTQMGT